jgi:hypothetical protein
MTMRKQNFKRSVPRSTKSKAADLQPDKDPRGGDTKKTTKGKGDKLEYLKIELKEAMISSVT